MDFPFVKEAISQLFSKPSCAMYPAVPSEAAPNYRGRIVYHADKCIGCGMCAQACPYGAPQLDEKARKMMKCDGCLDRLEKGGAPICVEACPQRAISFGEISELRRTFGTLAVTPPLPDPAQTRPALVSVPSPKAK